MSVTGAGAIRTSLSADGVDLVEDYDVNWTLIAIFLLVLFGRRKQFSYVFL